MESLNTLLARWVKEDVGALAGAEPAAVEATFASLGAVATTDIVELYRAIGGMDKMDNEYWRHWSLPEIFSENKVPSPFGVLFADYMISSWCYRAKAVSKERSAIYVDFFNGQTPTFVANSLEEFFSMYLEDPASALFGPPPEPE